jgi:hypothetical protein
MMKVRTALVMRSGIFLNNYRFELSFELDLHWHSVVIKIPVLATVWVLAFVFHRRGSTNRIVSIYVASLKDYEGKNSPGLASRHFLWDNHILQFKESIGSCIYIARFSQIMPVTAVVALLAFVFLRSEDKYRIVSISVTSPKVEQGQYCPCHSSWHFYGKNR